MQKFIFTICLTFLVIKSFSQMSDNRRIDQISFDYKNDKITINYNLANCKTSDRFLVRIEAYKTKNNTPINEAKTFTGDVNQVAGGGNKTVVWDIKSDGITSDGEQIYFRIVATLAPDVNLSKGMIVSTVFPGMGLSSVGGNNQIWQTIAGYGFLAGGVYYGLKSNTAMNNYKATTVPADADAFQSDAKTYRTYAITSVGVAACVWAYNYYVLNKTAKSVRKLEPQQIINNPRYEIISGTTPSKEINTQGLPPNLFAELNFVDANANGILEALEKSELSIKITNQGKGAAMKVHIKVTDNKPDSYLKITNPEQAINLIGPDQSVTIKIPIEAGVDIKTDEHRLTIEVTEYYHFDMDPFYLKLQTFAYPSAQLVYAGYEVIDKGEGTGAVIEDGQLQSGEQVKLKLTVQNTGQSIAKGVAYKIVSTNSEIRFLNDNAGTLGNMQLGETKNFYVTMQVTKRFTSTENLPIFLTLTEDLHKGDLKDFQIPIALNQKPPQPNIVTVQSDFSKLQKNVASFEYNSKKFTTASNIIDIKSFVPATIKRPKSIGVVFGIKKYKELAPAPYADNDASLMKEYFEKVLGVEQVILYTNNEVSGFIFDDVFNAANGELQKAVVKGETEVFIYYSGHGIPDKTGDNTYLFPSDGKISRLEMQGYNTDKLYENLEKLGAKHVTVILDACFSGSSRSTGTIQTENLVALKGIKIKPKKQTWNDNPNFTVINSSTGEETSLGYDASESGLFTYFLCAGLQGKADANGDKKITLGELKDYVIKNVMETSQKISGLQTPQFYGDDNIVITTY